MEESCLHEFTSHIGGKNAVVRIYPDRVEWDRRGETSSGKKMLGLATFGASLAVTGIRSKKGSSEMIPIKSLTSVTTAKDGFQMKVSLVTSGNTIDMRVSKSEADAIKDTLTRLILGTHPSQQPIARPVPEPILSVADVAASADPADQIRKLAELRDAGLLTAEEFEGKRLQLLDRI